MIQLPCLLPSFTGPSQEDHVSRHLGTRESHPGAGHPYLSRHICPRIFSGHVRPRIASVSASATASGGAMKAVNVTMAQSAGMILRIINLPLSDDGWAGPSRADSPLHPRGDRQVRRMKRVHGRADREARHGRDMGRLGLGGAPAASHPTCHPSGIVKHIHEAILRS